jgi:hypothetical protein
MIKTKISIYKLNFEFFFLREIFINVFNVCKIINQKKEIQIDLIEGTKIICIIIFKELKPVIFFYRDQK